MAADINAELLTAAGFAAARAALIAQYDWLVHQSSCSKFESIRATGLERHRDKAPPELVVEMLGDKAANVVFLHPLGADLRPDGTGERPFFHLAVHAADMPMRPGLDWSFSCYPWSLAGMLKRERPERENADIFVQCVRRSGSVLFYDPIPVWVLRGCPKSDPNSPTSKWPKLVDMTRADIAVF
jgi:hypothetical protein